MRLTERKLDVLERVTWATMVACMLLLFSGLAHGQAPAPIRRFTEQKTARVVLCTDAKMQNGDTVVLHFNIRDAVTDTAFYPVAAFWKSSDPTIVRVRSLGQTAVAYALRTGEAIVTARARPLAGAAAKQAAGWNDSTRRLTKPATPMEAMIYVAVDIQPPSSKQRCSLMGLVTPRAGA